MTGQGPWDTPDRLHGSVGLDPCLSFRAGLTRGSSGLGTIRLPSSRLLALFPILANSAFIFQKEDVMAGIIPTSVIICRS